MSFRPCFQLGLQETGILTVTAMALAPPLAASIKMGEEVPWDPLPRSQFSSKPTGKTLLLAPRDQLARVRISAILDKLLGCSAPPEPTHWFLSISLLMWDREGPGCSRCRVVAGLMGPRAAKPLAITAHRHLQGWSVGLGVCAGSITVLGRSLSPFATAA